MSMGKWDDLPSMGKSVGNWIDCPRVGNSVHKCDDFQVWLLRVGNLDESKSAEKSGGIWDEFKYGVEFWLLG